MALGTQTVQLFSDFPSTLISLLRRFHWLYFNDYATHLRKFLPEWCGYLIIACTLGQCKSCASFSSDKAWEVSGIPAIFSKLFSFLPYPISAFRITVNLTSPSCLQACLYKLGPRTKGMCWGTFVPWLGCKYTRVKSCFSFSAVLEWGIFVNFGQCCVARYHALPTAQLAPRGDGAFIHSLCGSPSLALRDDGPAIQVPSSGFKVVCPFQW